MQSVTLVGLRPRAVGNSIENLVTSGTATDANSASNRFPALSASGATYGSMSNKPPSSNRRMDIHAVGSGIKVQQLYDDDTAEVVSPPHNKPTASKVTISNVQAQDDYDRDFGATDISRQSTRLPAIQSGGISSAGGKMASESGVTKRSTTSVILPMSPETAMKLYMHKLSAFEQHEIFEYQKAC